jgi:hypothetical protein
VAAAFAMGTFCCEAGGLHSDTCLVCWAEQLNAQQGQITSVKVAVALCKQ